MTLPAIAGWDKPDDVPCNSLPVAAFDPPTSGGIWVPGDGLKGEFG